MEDRNIFKRKYLKLNHLERSKFVKAGYDEAEINVDKDYNSVNSNQI